MSYKRVNKWLGQRSLHEREHLLMNWGEYDEKFFEKVEPD